MVASVPSLRTNWRALALGQLLSFLLASAGAAQATLHLSCSLSAPTFAISLVYFVLSLHLILFRKYRHRESLPPDSNETDIWSAELDNNGTFGNDLPGSQNDTGNGGDHDVAAISSYTNSKVFYMASDPMYLFHLLGGLPLHAPPSIYFVLALFDVEANYLTVLAYRYTTVTSISLLDCLAIPSAMILSRLALKRRYFWMHLAGVALCLSGVVVNVLQDYNMGTSDGMAGEQEHHVDTDAYPQRIRGDILAIIGGILYGVNDTLCEISVRTTGSGDEYLGMVGFWAFLISMVQAALVERDDIAKFFVGFHRPIQDGDFIDDDAASILPTCSIGMSWGLLLAFVVVNVMSYIGATRFLLLSEAAFFNLSLLTGDLWTLAFSVVAQHIIPGHLFFVALGLIVSGILVYESHASPVSSEYEERTAQTQIGSSVQLVERRPTHEVL